MHQCTVWMHSFCCCNREGEACKSEGCNYWHFKGGQRLKSCFSAQVGILEALTILSPVAPFQIAFETIWWRVLVDHDVWPPIIEIISRHVLVDYVRKAGDDYWKPAFPVATAIMEPEAWVRISYETATNESSLVGCFQSEQWPQCGCRCEALQLSTMPIILFLPPAGILISLGFILLYLCTCLALVCSG